VINGSNKDVTIASTKSRLNRTLYIKY